MNITIQDITSGIGEDWLEILLEGKAKSLLQNVLDEINKHDIKYIYPRKRDIFNFAKFTPLKKVKVVIIGQDPYPTKGHAHGLAFSCLDKMPHSLKIIFKHGEIESDNPNLMSWALQGVLLINTAFTIYSPSKDERVQHMDLWSDYFTLIIRRLTESIKVGDFCDSLIFLLWGDKAKNAIEKACIKNQLVTYIKGRHPSYSAKKTKGIDDPKKVFMGDCNHFKVVNTLLEKKYGSGIIWQPYKVGRINVKIELNKLGFLSMAKCIVVICDNKGKKIVGKKLTVKTQKINDKMIYPSIELVKEVIMLKFNNYVKSQESSYPELLEYKDFIYTFINA